MTLTFVVIGIDHRHAFGMTQRMMDTGASCLGYWTKGTPGTLAGFNKRFPDVPRFGLLEHALESNADLALIASPPHQRCAHAVESIRHGMDVMVDKPGCITLSELKRLKLIVAQTKRIWSVNFSERFEVPAVAKASALVAEGAIGRVVHTAGFGPHRLNRATRPFWFFDRAKYGGILTDIASHQIDQYLHFTGAKDAEITHAHVANYANPHDNGLQDFGEITLRSESSTGFIRVDWFTPDALPTWGDGRLLLLGTEGYIELRKYVDVGGQPGTDHVFLVNGKSCQRIDASGSPLPYFTQLSDDIRNRTETAMSQEHCFKVMELALKAQAMAEGNTL